MRLEYYENNYGGWDKEAGAKLELPWMAGSGTNKEEGVYYDYNTPLIWWSIIVSLFNDLCKEKKQSREINTIKVQGLYVMISCDILLT